MREEEEKEEKERADVNMIIGLNRTLSTDIGTSECLHHI